MDIGIIGQQALLRGMVEVRAVVDAGDLAGRAAEDLWLPGIEMRIEVDDGDGAVGAVDGAEEGERDGVVAAEGDDAGEGLAVLCWAFLVGIGGRGSREDGVVAFFDLGEGPGVVVSVRYKSPVSQFLLHRSKQARTLFNADFGMSGTKKVDLRSHRDISTIQHCRPAVERVRSQWHVISTAEAEFT